MKNKYILNGQNGVIGSSLCNIFKQQNVDYSIFGLTKNISADVFLHLAARLDSDIDGYIDSNIILLQKTINYCYNSNIQNFVFFSGAKIYGEQNKLNVNENDCFCNPNIYAVTKILGEQILKQSNLNVLVLRLPGVLSNNSKTGVLSSIYTKLLNNEDVVLTNHNQMFNNFILVDDIWAFIDKYKFDKKYEVLNLAVNAEMTLYEIVLYMKNLIKSESKIKITTKNKQNFMNLSISKAQGIYNFKPLSSIDTLNKWCEEKLNER